MAGSPPMAFLSYVHKDDEFFGGRITALREQLQHAADSISEAGFTIFLDKDGIAWGQDWRDRIGEALAGSALLIPILSPRYFRSRVCCEELTKFLELERKARRKDLVLPILILPFDEPAATDESEAAGLKRKLGERNYRDWTKLLRELQLDRLPPPDAVMMLARELVAASLRVSAPPVLPAPPPPQTTPPPPPAPADALTGLERENDRLRAQFEGLRREVAQSREAEALAAAERENQGLRAEVETVRRELAQVRAASERQAAEQGTSPRPDGPKSARPIWLRMIALLVGAVAVGGIGAYALGPLQTVRELAEVRRQNAALVAELEQLRARPDPGPMSAELEELKRRNIALQTELAQLRTRPDPGPTPVSRLPGPTPVELLAAPPAVGKTFKDCEQCPLMVVVPASSFQMGSPGGEGGSNEHPRHRVEIAAPFAVGVHEVSFAEWDACVAGGGCNGYRPDDLGWGRGKQPVIYVSWQDAQAYLEWLRNRTGKTFRLLSEAEWEYVTRAGTTTAYWLGAAIGMGNANCYSCGSQWDGKQTAPVDAFRANPFGLYNVHGNVLEWVEDCYHDSYEGAPLDGTAWTVGDCSHRVQRGGSWNDNPNVLRSARRDWLASASRTRVAGFRVARALTP